MESSLILTNWPFSPFATALAAGALFAFCLTVLKRQKPPKRRHSAPARLGDLPRDPEGASNLYRTASEGFLNRTETGTAFRRLTSTPSISNFPAFDGRVTVPSPFHLSRFPFPERPFSFSDDLINIEKQFNKLYDFPLGRHSRGKRRGYSSLPNFGIVSGLGNPPFPGFIPISRHLFPFRRTGSLARRWKSISFEPDRKRSPSPSLRTPEKRKFAFYSDSVLLPGTLSFRKKCYSTAFEFSRFRATFCASIHGVCSRSVIDSPEPRSNLLSVPNLSVRRSESIPAELSRLEEVCDTNGTGNGNVSMNEKDTSDVSSSVNLISKDTEERYEFSVLLREVNTSPYNLSSDLDAETLDMIESGDESSFSQTERIDSPPSSKSKAAKRLDLTELDDEDSLDATEKSESSFIGSSVLDSVILKDEAYETVESESLDKPLVDEPEHKVLCGPGSVTSTATNGAISKVDSASLANKTGVNASGLRKRKTTGQAQLEKMESSKDELAAVKVVTAEGKLFSPTKDAEYNKEEEASEYESLKSDREGKTLEDSTTDSYYSILEKSENLLRKDSTEDEIDSSADFLTPISESANHKVLYESLEERLEEFSNEKNFEVRSTEKRDCDNESANGVLFQNEENSLERTRLKSLGSEETLVSDEEMVRKSADEKEVSSEAVKKKESFSPSPKKGAIRCLSKDEKVKIQEFSIYENGNQVLYEAVENNVAVKICSNSLEGKGARQKTPKSAEKTAEERSISAEKMKTRSFGDTKQAPVVCEGVVSIGPGFVDLSVRRPTTIEGRLARFQGGDNAKREPIERRDVTRRAESGQMERALAPERTHLTSDVRVGDDLRVVSDVWTENRGDVTVVVQDVWRKMDWREDDSFDVLTADFHPVATPERADEFRPTFEEFMPEEGGGGGLNAAIKELETLSGADSPRRVNRLLGLLKRDDERRKTVRPPPDEDGEWDRILGDLLRSVSELESARRRLDCSAAAAAGAEASAPAPAAHSAMDGAGETPTKVKSLRFKLDPDVFDVPSDDSFYEEEWKSDEPVRLVSVHASVVPAGQKSVARPVGIDLRVRLTDSSKRSHGGTTPPAQAKRRSPVADPRSLGWCQELSPVTENVDWRETFTPVTPPHREAPKTPEQPPKPVPNGILKTPSPKVENAASRDAANPFKGEMTNGHSSKPKEKPALPPKPPAVTNGFHAPKKLSLPRKKFVPDPEAIERITGYKNALTKPPIHPAIPAKPTPPLTRLNRAEIARKQYLDNRAQLSAANKTSDSSKKFQQFLTQAQTDRARIVTSVPDLNAIEKAVSEKWAKERGALQGVSPAKEDEDERHQRGVSSSRGSTPDDAWASYVQSFRKSVGGRRSQSLSYLETDVDLLVTDEEEDKWRSSSALDSGEEHPDDSDLGEELADDSGRARSEHELRIQRSLQSLPLPDWYKRSDKQKSGFILKSSAEKEKRGWAAVKSLASSTSSLASCGLRRPVRSLRSSRENIPWSRGSPDGPALSLALAKAFREPYLGWRARTSTTSSGVSSSSRTSPCGGGTDASLDGGVATTDVSFDGEDAFGRTTSSSPTGGVHPDDTGADVATVSMDTEGDSPKPPTAEDTCEDIHNMSMDTFEEVTTMDNLSSSDTTTDTSKQQQVKEVNPKRYSYSQSIYHSEWEDGEESRGEDRKVKERTVQEEDEEDSSPADHKVIWIESSFVGSRTTTSIVVLPEDQKGNQLERPASR